jgi:glycosyltransferase involved in cell wall biosynthesis
MKGLFVYSNFDFSKKSAGVTRMFYYAQALADKNTSVYLVSCSSSTLDKNAFIEIHPNVFILQNNKLTKSFLGTIKYLINLFKFSKEVTTERVFLFYPSPLVYLEVLALIYLKLFKKCTVYYELNEIRKYSSTFYKNIKIRNPKYSIKKIIYITVFSVLEILLKFYAGLICISTAMVVYGKKFNDNIIRIPILTDPYLKIECSNSIYSSPDVFNIGFSGTIHPDKENLLEFFNVLSRLKVDKYNFSFNLCGNIDEKHIESLLKKTAEDLGIKENITYYGNLNTLELSTFLKQQHLLVIPRGYTKQNNFGFSTKLSDYLNHGIPILITDVSDNKLFITDGENGFIVPPNDPNKMYTKIAYIIDEYENISKKIIYKATEVSKTYFYFKNFKKELGNFLFKQA